jgi:hypothetical protein
MKVVREPRCLKYLKPLPIYYMSPSAQHPQVLQYAIIIEVFMLSLQKEERSLPGFRTTKRLLGTILVDGGFVSPHDLEAALGQQKRSNEQLGEILVRMGVLDPVDLKAVLSVQKDLASRENAVRIAAGVRLLLGELLLKAKRITQAQIDYALMEHRQTGERLGETLVRLGFIKKCELDAVLAFQKNQVGAASEKLRLGELLVATGQVTRRQLEDVLERQRVSRKMIGELLVEAGYVQPHQVAQGLKLQQRLVTAALVAALSLSNLFVANEAHAASGGTSAQVTITATVREHTSMQVLAQAQELVVTNADIARGYVEVPAATRIRVKSNNPAGYLLTFEGMVGPGLLFDAINVLVGGREVQLSPNGGGWVPQPYVRGGITQDVTYRFTLSKNARPGTYGWPLMITAIAR